MSWIMHGPAGQRLVVVDPSDKNEKLRFGWKVIPSNLDGYYEAERVQRQAQEAKARSVVDDAHVQHGSEGEGEGQKEEGDVDNRLSVNTATKVQLQKVLGLTTSQISRVVEARTVKPFESIEELQDLLPEFAWYDKAHLYKV